MFLLFHQFLFPVVVGSAFVDSPSSGGFWAIFPFQFQSPNDEYIKLKYKLSDDIANILELAMILATGMEGIKYGKKLR